MQKYFLITVLIIISKLSNVYPQGGDIHSIEKGLAHRDDIVFFGGFEEGYNNEAWETRWGIKFIDRGSSSQVITNAFDGGKSLWVEYPAGGVGPKETGVQFPMVLDDMPGISKGYYDELYLRYYIKFEEGFDFGQGGKLPGLMGGGDSWTRSGGNQPDGTNGWTLRFMWRTGGRIVVYAYVPKSENGKYSSETWGQDLDCSFIAEPGKWHCIEQYVNVGTSNKDNGKLKVWIDGIIRLDISDIRFWDEENNSGRIGGIYFSTFHGGNTRDWAPANTSHAQFDGFVAAKNRIGIFTSRTNESDSSE
jgi:hypothetical protein